MLQLYLAVSRVQIFASRGDALLAEPQSNLCTLAAGDHRRSKASHRHPALPRPTALAGRAFALGHAFVGIFVGRIRASLAIRVSAALAGMATMHPPYPHSSRSAVAIEGLLQAASPTSPALPLGHAPRLARGAPAHHGRLCGSGFLGLVPAANSCDTFPFEIKRKLQTAPVSPNLLISLAKSKGYST